MSKELTPLEIINIKLKDKNNKYDRRVVNCNHEYLYLIKDKELAIIGKSLKALEIIKEKEVDVSLLRQVFDNEEHIPNALFYYNNHIDNYRPHDNLTQEEYELLREVLE